MKIVLRIKNWQIFPFILLGYLLIVLSVENNRELTIVLNIFGYLIVFGWILLLGKAISKVSNRDDSLFTINLIIVVISCIVFTLLGKGKEFEVEGILALPFMYLIFAVIHIFIFPVKILKSIELNRNAKFYDYWDLFLLVIFGMIGIWIIQPKLNKLTNKASA